MKDSEEELILNCLCFWIVHFCTGFIHLILIAFYMYYLYYLPVTLFCTFILHLFYIVVSETVLLSAGGLVRSFLQKRFLISMNYPVN